MSNSNTTRLCAPDPDSLDGIVIVIVFDVGTVVTINLMSSKSAAAKFEPSNR